MDEPKVCGRCSKPKKADAKEGEAFCECGRPSVVTEDVVVKLIEAFKIDATNEEAARQAGISVDAYYDACNRDPEFAEKMEAAKAVPMLLLKSVVMQAVGKGDGNLALKVLKSRQRHLYHEKVEEEVTTRTVEQALDEAEEKADYPQEFKV